MKKFFDTLLLGLTFAIVMWIVSKYASDIVIDIMRKLFK